MVPSKRSFLGAVAVTLCALPLAVSAQVASRLSLAEVERSFPECSGMFSQEDVDLVTRSAVDPAEEFERWRATHFSLIEAPPPTVCRSRVWRSVQPAAARAKRAYAGAEEEVPRSGLRGKSAGLSQNYLAAGGVNEYQGETTAAVNPSNPQQLVAGANTFYRDPSPACQSPTGGAAKTYGTQALYGSTDGGKTWTHRCAPWPATLTGGQSGATIYFGSDPALAWDGAGNAYAAYMLLSWNDNAYASPGVAIVVAKSSDAGQTWTPLGVVVDNLASTTKFDDKQMIAVDTSSGGAYSHPGRIYVIWDENNKERVAYSDDGVSWTTKALSAPGLHVGADVKVGPDGAVYAVWNRVYGPDPVSGKAANDETYFSRSLDGGVSWPAGQLIFTHSWASFQKYYTPAPQNERGINSFLSLDVNRNPSSPYYNRLHAAWADGTTTCCPLNSFRLDVYSSYSTDGGASWASRIRVNDDPQGWASTHFFPWLAVDQSDGTVNVAWYDNRNDPVNAEQAQVYYARSANGGASFAANLNLMDNGANFLNAVNSSDENSWSNLKANLNQYGDYLGVAAANRKVFVVSCDSRQFFPAHTTSVLKEDVAAVVVTNCSQPLFPHIQPTATLSGGGIQVAWPAAALGTNATSVAYTLTRYKGASCTGASAAVPAGTNPFLDTPLQAGTYSYRITAKNNCPGTALTPMSSTTACSNTVVKP